MRAAFWTFVCDVTAFLGMGRLYQWAGRRLFVVTAIEASNRAWKDEMRREFDR